MSTRAFMMGAMFAAGLGACACSRARVDEGVGVTDAKREGAMAGFSCEKADVGFGHAGAVIEQCAELLPGFYRAVLSGAGLPYATIFRGVWVGDERVDLAGGEGAQSGLARFEAWARAVKLYEAPKLDAWPVGQVLEVFGALPAQFDGESIASVSDPATGERGGVQRSPFVVTAYKVGYVAAASPGGAASADGPSVIAGPAGPAAGPGGPAGPAGPAAGPGGPAGPAAGPSGPAGPASGPAGPAGGPGGYSPSVIGRARLLGTDDYRFRWEVEVRAPGGAWTAVTPSGR